jgi:hypothetical protein
MSGPGNHPQSLQPQLSFSARHSRQHMSPLSSSHHIVSAGTTLPQISQVIVSGSSAADIFSSSIVAPLPADETGTSDMFPGNVMEP